MRTCAPYHAILEMSRADSEEAPPDPVLQAAQAGDPDAFEAIYRAHMGRVYALCLGMTADPVVAAELLQDTFIQVWRELSAFRGQSALGSWIHRIAVNVVLMRRRADARRESRLRPMSGDDTGVGARRELLEERLDLSTALATLTPDVRAVYVLREIEGYGYGEISDMTGLSEVALRSHISRARRQIIGFLRL